MTTFSRCLCVGLCLLVSISVIGSAQGAPYESAAVAVPFDVREVRLLDGPFRHAQDLDAQWLLSIDVDRLLSWYRKEAKLEPKGEVYGGWESMGVAGHSLGHYLSACSRMVYANGNPEFKRRVDYIVEELAKCQQAGGDGFVGAMPRGRAVFAEVSKGDIRSQGFDLNGSWVPWYTLHKLLAGLLDAYEYCGNEQAKDVAVRLADWAVEITKDLNDEQWQKMLACEHGGMNESLAEIARITGKEKYLVLSKKFYHKAILDPLAEDTDILPGKHSNTQIPKIIGAAKIADITGDERFAHIAEFFWQTMVYSHTYANGGNSIGEHLGQPGKLNDRLGNNTAETCNTYNMLKLTSALFAREPKAEYADYAERALWNHILASQSRETGRVCYFVPLQAGAKKPFMDPEAFTCCSGSGMENHVRYGEYIYAHSPDTLWVNQFISSELTWKEKGIKVRQIAELPEVGKVRLEISCASPQEFSLQVRHPHWCAEGFQISLNGQEQPNRSTPGSFVEIQRVWENGDSVELQIPLGLRTESMPDNPKRIAVFSGPVLLAGVLSSDTQGLLPVFVCGDRPAGDWIGLTSKPGPTFATSGVGRPLDQQLLPFCMVTDEPYIVYWDVFTEEEWNARKEAYEAELKFVKELAERTVDWLAIGEMQPERDHQVEGEKTDVGDFNGRKYRHAMDGGWFSCRVKLPADQPADLVVSYWGSETGPRTFDIQLDGKPIATQSLQRNKPNEFWDQTYALPEELTKGKAEAVLRFQAHPGNLAGGVYGIRVVKRGK